MTIEANSAVKLPTMQSVSMVDWERESSGLNRMMRIPPALMIPACISAETGVGVSIVSGSQLWNGNCADLRSAANTSNPQIQLTA